MQHLMMADKSLLAGDAVTELLAEYTALVSKISGGDVVKVNALTQDGHAVVATLVLNAATVMAAETAESSLPEPDNGEAEHYLRERLDSYSMTPATLHDFDERGSDDATD